MQKYDNHVVLNNEEWNGYCEYLRVKLEGLEKEKKTLEEKIGEIYRILNPAPVVIEDKPATEEKEEEKCLSVRDIAKKYNTTEQCVIDACGKGAIPYHMSGCEFKFTKSDVEYIASIVARKNVFPQKKERAKSGARTKVEGFLTKQDVLDALKCDSNEYTLLRKRGFLTGEVKDEGNGSGAYFYYTESEVNALAELVKTEGGIEAFLKNVR